MGPGALYDRIDRVESPTRGSLEEEEGIKKKKKHTTIDLISL